MKTLIFSDKTKQKVIEETGKFYITKKSQFRKSNPDIVEVIEEEDAPGKESEKPKTKKSAPKKAEEGE